MYLSSSHSVCIQGIKIRDCNVIHLVLHIIHEKNAQWLCYFIYIYVSDTYFTYSRVTFLPVIYLNLNRKGFKLRVTINNKNNNYVIRRKKTIFRLFSCAGNTALNEGISYQHQKLNYSKTSHEPNNH